MVTNRRLKYFITLFLSPFLISALLLHPAIITLGHAASTITSDGTMGTTINQTGNVYNIDGGTIKGTNQFHSFGLFSVGTGDKASFNGPPVISNIIGRVTGGQQSIIDGLLKTTISGANLYLLNPYGVLFGPNAALSVSGSFHVSTADYLRMTDGVRFYADLGKQSTLSTVPVAAFGFLSNKPAAISIQGSNLRVPEGKTLSIIGGDINITGGQIVAPGGRINIASVASPGEVIPVESMDAPDLQMSSFDRLGNINVLNSATLDVSSQIGSGTVIIRGGKLLIENSRVLAYTRGDIDGAKVVIDIGVTGDLEVQNGGLIEGHGGSIEVNADSVLISGGITTGNGAIGNSGDIHIKAKNVQVKDWGHIDAQASGYANGGDIQIKAKNLQVEGDGYIDAITFGSGNAGTIGLNAESILIHRGSIEVSNDSSGNAGDIQIKAKNLQVEDGAYISATTEFSGNGGSIKINADSILISGLTKTSSITASTFVDGNAGDIQIKAKNLQVEGGGYIGARTFGSGRGGNILVEAPWVTVANGGYISAMANGTGTGGSIELNGNQIQLFNGARISAESAGTGNAGNINIIAGSTLQMKNSSITTEAEKADGGNIDVHAGYMVKLTDSKITASVGGGPQTVGGNITIDPKYIVLNDSKVIANAYEGKGGNIKINADVFLASPESIVDASSALGINGTVDIRAPITSISGTLVPMQGNFLSAEALLRDRCAARIRGEKSSSFVVSGRDGLPIRPGSVLPSPIY